MCAPSPPAAPDYGAAATAQGAANIDAARATAKLSNPNITTPYGSQTVSYGANGDQDIPSVTQTLTPEQQAIFDTNQQGQQGLADLGLGAVQRAGSILGQDVSFSGAPTVGTSSETRDKVLAAMMGRADEDYAKQTDQTRSSLIASGIPVGSKAFADAQQMIERSRNDARQQAEIGAGNAANQQFGQDMAGRQQAITEILAQRQTPLNEINAFRSGSQVNTPQFQQYQGATVAPAPVFGAAQATGQAQTNAYNQQAAGSNAMMSGLFSLGGAALGAPVGTFSDRRLKSNVQRVGEHSLGIGIYEYDIFGNRERGVMADELEEVLPEAVSTHSSGFKMVDYAMIGGRP